MGVGSQRGHAGGHIKAFEGVGTEASWAELPIGIGHVLSPHGLCSEKLGGPEPLKRDQAWPCPCWEPTTLKRLVLPQKVASPRVAHNGFCSTRKYNCEELIPETLWPISQQQ